DRDLSSGHLCPSVACLGTQALTAVGAWRRLAKADGDEVPMEWVELRWLWLTSRYNQRTATSGFRTDGQADRQDRAELHRRQANRSTRSRQGNPRRSRPGC